MDLVQPPIDPASAEVIAAYHRQAARLRELETWLALMIAQHGIRTDLGYRYQFTAERASAIRQQMPRMSDPRVLISGDLDSLIITLDAL